MKEGFRMFYRTWCLFSCLTFINTQSKDATTVTPVPVFQVTPPSDSNQAVTSQPKLYHDSLYESVKSNGERHPSFANWNTANNSLRETSSTRLLNHQQSDAVKEQNESLTRAYNNRFYREDTRGRVFFKAFFQSQNHNQPPLYSMYMLKNFVLTTNRHFCSIPKQIKVIFCDFGFFGQIAVKIAIEW